MAGNSDLNIRLVIEALDYATKDIEHVNKKVKELGATLTESEYSRAASGMEAFGRAVKESTDPMAEATVKSLALSAAITGIATALAGKVYQSAVDYESAMADLAKVSDGGREEAEQYGAALNKLALQYAANGQELLAAMTNFKQAGFESSESFSLVEESLKLMIAGELEAGEASQGLVSILKGFGAPASEASRAVDILNEVSNKYATNVRELTAGMAAISPIAKQMGFNLEETTGLLTPIIEVFQSGTEAADALKTGLQKLTDDSKPVRAALESIGVAQLTANGEMRSGKDIFLDVARVFTTLNDNQRQFLTAQLVGIDQSARMSTVFSNMGNYLQVTATAAGASGSALNEVTVRLNTAQAKAAAAQESFRQLSVTLGNTVKPEITGVISATGNLAAAFDRAIQAGDLAPLLNAIRPQIGAIENLFAAMASNLEMSMEGLDWTPLVDGLREVSGEFGEAFAALFDGMDLTTVDGLRSLLQSLINVLGDFSQYIAGVVDGLEPFLDSLNRTFTAISQGYPEIAKLIGQIQGLATSANQIIPVIANVGSTIFGAAGAIAEFVFKIGLAVSALKLLSALGVPVGAMFATLASTISGLLPGLATAAARFTGLTAGIQGLLSVGALIGGYKVGETLREWGLQAGYAAEQGTLAARAFEMLATEAEKAELHISETSDKIAAKLRQISADTGITVRSMRELERAVADGTIIFNEATGAYERAQQAQEKQAESARQSAESAALQAEISEALRAQFEKLGLTYDTASGQVENLKGQIDALRAEYERLIAAGDAQGAVQILAQIQELETRLSATGVEAIGAAERVQRYNDALTNARAEVERLTEVEAAGKRAAEELAAVQEQQRLNLERLNGERGQSLPVMASVAAESDRLAEREAALTEQIEAGKRAGEALSGARIAENKAASDLGKALDDLLKKREQEKDLAGLVTDAIRDEGQLRVTHLTNLAKEAELRGDTRKATQLAIDAHKAEIETLQQVLEAKKAESEAEWAVVAALQAKAAADGAVSGDEQAAIDRAIMAAEAKGRESAAIQEAIRAKQAESASYLELSAAAEAASAAQARAYTAERIAAIKEAEESTHQVSHATRSAGDSATYLAGEIKKLGIDTEYLTVAQEAANAAYAEAAAETQAWVDSLTSATSKMTGATASVLANTDAYIRRLQDQEKTALAAAEAAAAHAKSVDELSDRLDDLNAEYDAGEIGLADYIDRLERLRGSYQRLSDEDLSDLTDALADAKEAMDEMSKSAGDSLRDLQAEWAEYRGEIVKATLLQQEADRLDVELAIIEAKKNGNTEELAFLNQKLALLKEYQAAQLEEAALEEAQNKIDAANDAAAESARLAGLSNEERAYESAINNLKKQLARAIVSNDAALQSSLLAQIQAEEKRHETAMTNIEAETKARTQSSTKTSGSTTTAASSGSASSSTTTPVRTVNVNISTPSGASGSVRVVEGDEDTLERLLKSLESGAAVAQ